MFLPPCQPSCKEALGEIKENFSVNAAWLLIRSTAAGTPLSPHFQISEELDLRASSSPLPTPTSSECHWLGTKIHKDVPSRLSMFWNLLLSPSSLFFLNKNKIWKSAIRKINKNKCLEGVEQYLHKKVQVVSSLWPQVQCWTIVKQTVVNRGLLVRLSILNHFCLPRHLEKDPDLLWFFTWVLHFIVN